MTRLNGLASIILILSMTIYGIIEWRSSVIEKGDAIDNELTPDFVAEALKSDIYTQKGQLSHIIEADRMEHYSALEVTHFEQPNYTLFPKNSTVPWHISAKEATLYKNNRVILTRRVRLKVTEENSLLQEIHCKYLELDLNTNIISSEQTVMVQGKDFTMYGSGLIIDLNTKQMTLTEHVRTIYKKINL
ncbi:MAG: LPS export ABC transporter periplasmic protein LptC [Colwellia sp.]